MRIERKQPPAWRITLEVVILGARQPVVLIVLGLAFMLSACQSTPVSIQDARGSNAIDLWASSKCVRPGDTLTVRSTVTNRDSVVHQMEAKDQPVLDLSIGYPTSAGSRIIRWSDGKPLTSDLTHLELQPGQSKSIELQWVVIDPAPSTIGVAARFFDDPRFTNDPLSPGMTVYGPGGCVGFIGP